MILPKEIRSRHKIRDAKIIQLFIDGTSQIDISKIFELTHPRINQILYENKNLLLGDAKYEKAKRINYYRSQIKTLDGRFKDSTKDPAELIESIRKEFEGDSQVNIVTQFLNIEPAENVSNRLTEIQK